MTFVPLISTSQDLSVNLDYLPSKPNYVVMNNTPWFGLYLEEIILDYVLVSIINLLKHSLYRSLANMLLHVDVSSITVTKDPGMSPIGLMIVLG